VKDYNDRTFFDKVLEVGDSPIFVGISYLKIVASQIDYMRLASRGAMIEPETYIYLWLNELKIFYNLVESRVGLDKSEKEIIFFEVNLIDGKLEKIDIKITEKEKYERWFKEIENMIERNFTVKVTGGYNPFFEKRYINNKKIILELGRCMRELMRDANKKHLIMPEGMRDLKEIAKKEWIDRAPVKDFEDG